MTDDISPTQRLELIIQAKTRLVEAREALYGNIDQINKQLEKLEVAERSLTPEIIAKVSETLGMSDLDISMSHHPAGRKQGRYSKE